MFNPNPTTESTELTEVTVPQHVFVASVHVRVLVEFFASFKLADSPERP